MEQAGFIDYLKEGIKIEDNKRIYFAVKAVLLKNNKFLVMHKGNAPISMWELPGGRMEFGETAEETLAREIMEETGLMVRSGRLLDTWNLLKETYQITGVIYLCKIDKGEVRLSEEHDSYKWLDASPRSVNEMHKVFREKMIKWDWNKIKY